MYLTRHELTVTTDASGDGLNYTPAVNGNIRSIEFVKPGSGGFETTVDFTITLETTGRTVWGEENVTASKTVNPREQIHDTAGTGLVYDGSNKQVASIPVSNERIKIVVAQGGDTKSGTFRVIVEGS